MERSGGYPERRQQILDAALRVFSERGYGGASIRGISSAAGLKSPPLVYWYFESKRDLFAEVLAYFSRRAPAFRFGEQMDRPPEAVLPDLAREELRAFEEEVLVRLLRVAVAEAAMDPATGDRFFGMLRGGAMDFLTRYFEVWGRRRGAVDFEPGTEARAFFGSLFFYVLNREVLPGFGGRLPDRDAYADSVARQVLQRLGSDVDRAPTERPAQTRALPPALTRRRAARGRDLEATSSGDEGALKGDGDGDRGLTPPETPGDGKASRDVHMSESSLREGSAGEPVGEEGGESHEEAGGVRAGSPPAGGPGSAGGAGDDPGTSGRSASEGAGQDAGETGREGSAGGRSRFFEELSRERPEFVPPGAPPLLPPRQEIPFSDPAASRGERVRAEPQPASGDSGREGRRSASPEGTEGTESSPTEAGTFPAPASRQPFPAEPPPVEPTVERVPLEDTSSGGERSVQAREARGGVRKALFFVAPVHGHVQAALPVARELVSRGEEVVLYATEEFEELARGAGVGFRTLDGDFALPEELSEGYLAATRDLRPAVIRSISDSLRGVGKLAGWAGEEEADYVVYDPLCPWGRLIADSLGLPAIGLYTTFVARGNSPLARRLLPNLEGTPPPALVMQMVRLRWELREARSALGLPGLRSSDLLLRPGDLNVVTLPQRFQPPTGGALDERFVFVGPSILPRDERAYFSLEQIEAQPTVFVSLGSAYDEGRARLLGGCMEAFEPSRWLVVMETGPGTDPALLGQAPPNVIAWPRVPRLEVLRRCDVFVTDGDVGATMEALWFGVPLVVVPRTPEHGVMAERVNELKTGLVLDPRTASAGALREAVDAVGADPSYHAGLADLWVAARQAGGYRLAADRIQAFVAQALRS